MRSTLNIRNQVKAKVASRIGARNAVKSICREVVQPMANHVQAVEAPTTLLNAAGLRRMAHSKQVGERLVHSKQVGKDTRRVRRNLSMLCREAVKLNPLVKRFSWELCTS